VLLYGASASDRQKRYFDALQAEFLVRVETETFGGEIKALLDRTKLVVNIHPYDDALLVTTRLSQALSHGAHVVSEEASDPAERAFFENSVHFVPTGDVGLFVERVGEALTAWREPVAVPEDQGFSGMRFHVLRALHGLGVISCAELEDACVDMRLPSTRLILALPEHVARYDFALARRQPGAVPFHVLRDADGWRGCAKSYRLIASVALRQGCGRLMIDLPPGSSLALKTGRKIQPQAVQRMATEQDA
jgi:hypothetical protein